MEDKRLEAERVEAQARLEKAVEETKVEAQKETDEAARAKILTVVKFLRLAGHRRNNKSGDEDEDEAIERVLVLVYGGDQSAVDACLKLANGSEEPVDSFQVSCKDIPLHPFTLVLDIALMAAGAKSVFWCLIFSTQIHASGRLPTLSKSQVRAMRRLKRPKNLLGNRKTNNSKINKGNHLLTRLLLKMDSASLHRTKKLPSTLKAPLRTCKPLPSKLTPMETNLRRPQLPPVYLSPTVILLMMRSRRLNWKLAKAKHKHRFPEKHRHRTHRHSPLTVGQPETLGQMISPRPLRPVISSRMLSAVVGGVGSAATVVKAEDVDVVIAETEEGTVENGGIEVVTAVVGAITAAKVGSAGNVSTAHTAPDRKTLTANNPNNPNNPPQVLPNRSELVIIC